MVKSRSLNTVETSRSSLDSRIPSRPNTRPLDGSRWHSTIPAIARWQKWMPGEEVSHKDLDTADMTRLLRKKIVDRKQANSPELLGMWHIFSVHSHSCHAFGGNSKHRNAAFTSLGAPMRELNEGDLSVPVPSVDYITALVSLEPHVGIQWLNGLIVVLSDRLKD